MLQEANSHVPDIVDTSKIYVCYFCEEEITFTMPTGNVLVSLSETNLKPYPRWTHIRSGLIVCNTDATPSNLELRDLSGTTDE